MPVADRMLDEAGMAPQTSMALRAAQRMNNVWAAQRKKMQQAATPPQIARQAGPNPGQVQPDFTAAPTISMDPMDQPPLNLPLSLSGTPPRSNVGDRSKILGLNDDMKSTKFDQTRGRSKTLDVNKTPDQYNQDLATVMDSELMKKMSGLNDQEAELRKQFIQNMPVQSDLSPTMALADYIAGPGGKAQAGYNKPMSYEQITGNLSALLGQEIKSRQAQAGMAFQQAGTLKAGEQKASADTGLSTGRQQGSKEEPIHQPFMQPLVQGQAILKAYKETPGVKEANEQVANANYLQQLLAKPGWYTDNIMKAQVLQGMHVNRVTQNELQVYGNGSQGLWNRGQVALSKLEQGRSFSQNDLHDIKEFADAATRAAIVIRDQKHKEVAESLGQLSTLGQPAVEGLLNSGEVHPTVPPLNESAKSAENFAAQFMQLMQNGAKK